MDRIEVQQGPTGITIHEAQNRAYVLNRFDASISVIDLHSNRVVRTVDYFDPTPDVIVAGRPLLYDTHATSGLGQASCASCHVDSRTDRLAWDLGDPAARIVTKQMDVLKPEFDKPARTERESVTFHPMKGPMKTQTLQDIIGSPVMHHRGDREDIFAFAGTYENLQGDDVAVSDADMSALEAYLDTIHFPPNPHRNIDNSLSTSVSFQGPDSGKQLSRQGEGATGNAVVGLQNMLHPNSFNRSCLRCHQGERGRSGVLEDVDSWHVGQLAVAEPLGGFYERMGMFWNSPDGSTSGFGFRTDGSQDSKFLHEGTTNNDLAVFLSWDGPKEGIEGLSRDSHAGVGQQVQLSASTNSKARALIAIADSGNIGLVVQGTFNGTKQGFAYTGSNRFQSDKLGEIVSYSELLKAARQGDQLVLTLVARGTEYRLALDADLDGKLNRNDNAPFQSSEDSWRHCASEGSRCNTEGTSVVRYGSSENWLYGVFTSSVNCSDAQFGDPEVSGTKACQYLPSDVVEPLLPPSNASTCAQEGQVCTLPAGSTASVWYGKGNKWHVQEALTGTVNCNNAKFGDSNPGVRKECRYVVTSTGEDKLVPPAHAQDCAREGQVCVLPAGSTATVWYGARDKWRFQRDRKDSVNCNNATFGDPIEGVVKRCQYVITRH